VIADIDLVEAGEVIRIRACPTPLSSRQNDRYPEIRAIVVIVCSWPVTGIDAIRLSGR